MTARTVRVSVVIPTYNRRAILQRAVASARARIGTEDEIIVVDDGSTDKTAEALSGARADVVLLRTEHRGPAAARNAGIRVARGRFVAFLDSDDEWLSGGLDEQVDALAGDPSLGLAYAAALNVDGEGRPLATRPRHPCRGRCLKALLTRNFVTTSTAVVPRVVLDEAGLFDEDLDHSMDWDLWLRIAERWGLFYLDRPVAMYRFHGDQQIRDREAVDDCRRRILAKHLERYERERADLVPLVRRLLSYRLLRLGRLLLRRGDREAARERFREAAHLRPLSRLTAARYGMTVRVNGRGLRSSGRSSR